MELHAKKPGTPQKGPGMKSKLAFALAASVALSGPALAATSCSPDCPLDCENVKEYDMTMREGETRETLSGGTKITIEILDIYQSAESRNDISCEVHGGGAKVKLTVESDPQYTKEFHIVPNSCFAVQDFCIRFNDAEVEQDLEFVGIPDAGTGGTDTGTGGDGGSSGSGDFDLSMDRKCKVTNERVSFTLTLAEGAIPVAPDAGTGDASTADASTY